MNPCMARAAAVRCALVATSLAVAAPSTAAPAVTATSKPAATGVVSQAVEAEDVLIQGKLYSPSALFILTRPEESFGRDAVMPHYLNAAPATQFAGSQLQPAVLQRHVKPPVTGVVAPPATGSATTR